LGEPGARGRDPKEGSAMVHEGTDEPGWVRQASRLVTALARYRLSLRRASARAGDPTLAVRLRRLAFRRRAVVEELIRHAPPSPDPSESSDVLADLQGEDRVANEIGSLAACLRANRRLRIAVERTLQARPPEHVTNRLCRLRDDIEREFGLLNARLRDIALAGVPTAAFIVE